ncbi:MAG: D-alanyl-D-alanine carboxypeptidase, partial [Deltaproteobacteria bacterium]|nr:D-alanyl-D-alanine carboxypeptidase [Deltaproteobacteria bacterium]
HRSNDHFIPASTIKVATAACALYTLGKGYRFITEFYTTGDGDLAVKGYGDPLLLSQELAQIAGVLDSKGVRQVRNIILDDSYFDSNIVIDGVSRSDNPYDALNGALFANFNTINVKKLKNGKVVSAEPQTPITPLAEAMAKKLRAGTHRINLGNNPEKARLYVGELLAVFLKEEGVPVTGAVRPGRVPSSADLVYRHRSSKDLTEILRGMLDFSTNFTANQLFLAMGAQQLGPPATVEKGVTVLKSFLKNNVGWTGFSLAEGSGLSRQTQVTPRQLVTLLEYFQSSQDLLPLHDKVFLAKTGTLNGANTYIGYFPLPGGHTARFALMVNDHVPYDYKFKLAKMLYNGFHGIKTANAQKIAR